MLFDYLEGSKAKEKPPVHHRIIIYLLKLFLVFPKHVAFIMDGNRRYASSRGLEKHRGHVFGFDKLTEVLRWCNDFDEIEEVTVYALSVENFKRSKIEVDTLLNLARDKLSEVLEHVDLLVSNQVCVNFWGELDMLPDDLREVMVRLERETACHSKPRSRLNVCVAYTSRHEMASSIRKVAEKCANGLADVSQVNDKLLADNFYGKTSLPLDLLVRTSGEIRLSDFMLFQCSRFGCRTTTDCILAFFKVFWPDLSRWHLYMAFLYYWLELKGWFSVRILFSRWLS